MKRVVLLLLFLSLPVEGIKLSYRIMPEILETILNLHPTRDTFSPFVVRSGFESFVDSLDPDHSLFTEKEKDLLVAGLYEMHISGWTNFKSLEKAFNFALERTEEELRTAEKLLKDPKFKWDENTKIVLNPKNVVITSPEQREERVRSKIEYSVAMLTEQGMPLSRAKEYVLKVYQSAASSSRKADKTIRAERFLAGFTRALDPHTTYVAAEKVVAKDSETTLSHVGIGVQFRPGLEEMTEIMKVLEGSGAQKAGLKRGDKIVSVMDEHGEFIRAKDMTYLDFNKQFEGEAGSKVRMIIERGTIPRRRMNVEVERVEIEVPEARAHIRYEDHVRDGKSYKIGIIRFPVFYASEKHKLSADVRELLNEAKGKGVNGILVDLSNNGGGDRHEGVQTTGLFVGKGPIGSFAGKKGASTFGTGATPAYEGPLVILTNRGSASASEIFAGVLQDYGKAVVVGSDRTFGKGSSQGGYTLPDHLGDVYVTEGLYHTPSGKSPQHKGVLSDIVIPTEDPNLLRQGEKEMKYSLGESEIKPFFPNENIPKRLVNRELLETLKQLSADRVARSPEFESHRERPVEPQAAMTLAEWKNYNRAVSEIPRNVEGYIDNTPQLREAAEILTDWAHIRCGASLKGVEGTEK